MYLKKMTWLCALLALAVTIGGVFDASMVEGKTKKETAKNAKQIRELQKRYGYGNIYVAPSDNAEADKEEGENRFALAHLLNKNLTIAEQPFVDDDSTWSAFGQGMAEGIFDIDNLLFGLADMNDKTAIDRICQKIIDNNINFSDPQQLSQLSDTEIRLFNEAIRQAELQALRSGTVSAFYEGGSTAGTSLAMMTEFAVTGYAAGAVVCKAGKVLGKMASAALRAGRASSNFAKAINIATKATTKVGNVLGKGELTASTAAGRAAQAVGQGLVDVAKGVGEVAVKSTVQSAISPRVVSNAVGASKQKVELNEQGVPQISEKPNSQDILNAALDQYIEYATEMSTEHVTMKGLGMFGNLFKSFAPNIKANGSFKTMCQIFHRNEKMAKCGLDGILEPVEEIYGNELRHAMGLISDDEYDQFWSKDNWGVMMMGFAPQTALTGLLNAAGLHSRKGKFREATSKFTNTLRTANISAEDIANLRNELTDVNSFDDVPDIIKNFLKDKDIDYKTRNEITVAAADLAMRNFDLELFNERAQYDASKVSGVVTAVNKYIDEEQEKAANEYFEQAGIEAEWVDNYLAENPDIKNKVELIQKIATGQTPEAQAFDVYVRTQQYTKSFDNAINSDTDQHVVGRTNDGEVVTVIGGTNRAVMTENGIEEFEDKNGEIRVRVNETGEEKTISASDVHVMYAEDNMSEKREQEINKFKEEAEFKTSYRVGDTFAIGENTFTITNIANGQVSYQQNTDNANQPAEVQTVSIAEFTNDNFGVQPTFKLGDRIELKDGTTIEIGARQAQSGSLFADEKPEDKFYCKVTRANGQQQQLLLSLSDLYTFRANQKDGSEIADENNPNSIKSRMVREAEGDSVQEKYQNAFADALFTLKSLSDKLAKLQDEISNPIDQTDTKAREKRESLRAEIAKVQQQIEMFSAVAHTIETEAGKGVVDVNKAMEAVYGDKKKKKQAKDQLKQAEKKRQQEKKSAEQQAKEIEQIKQKAIENANGETQEEKHKSAFADTIHTIKNLADKLAKKNTELNKSVDLTNEDEQQKRTQLREEAQQLQDEINKYIAVANQIADEVKSDVIDTEQVTDGEFGRSKNEEYKKLVDKIKKELNQSAANRRILNNKDNQVKLNQAMLRGIVNHLRQMGIEVITDEEEAQRVLRAANEGGQRVRDMGSKTKKAMQQIAERLANTKMSDIQKAISSVFTGFAKKSVVGIKRTDGNTIHLITKSGNEQQAGALHSIYRHYGGDKQSGFAAEDVLLIPDIIANGTVIKRGLNKCYRANINGNEYEVVTIDLGNGNEGFVTFYKNEKGKTNTDNGRTRSSQDDNTSLQAQGEDSAPIRQIDNANANIENNLREQRVYHGTATIFDKFDTAFVSGFGTKYGWGLYFSDVKDIGKIFARFAAVYRISPHRKDKKADLLREFVKIADRAYQTAQIELNNILTAINQKYGFTIGDVVSDMVGKLNQEQLKTKLKEYNLTESQIDDIVSQAEEAERSDYQRKRWFNIARAKEDKIQKYIDDLMLLYTVEIPDEENDNYLDFDSIVTNEFKDKLFDILSENATEQEKEKIKNAFFYTVKWSDIFQKLSGGTRELSEALSRMGYVGIKKKHQEGRNESVMPTVASVEYVIFNADDAQIVDRTRFSKVPNQDVFFSNAARAVENIKQEKATPQQWLAMIEKQGGLKAGEDKWIGLSDWLQSQNATIAPPQQGETSIDYIGRVADSKKTITKQQVLDFINQNKIQIEEVEYGEYDDQAVFEGYRREYKGYYDEAVEAGEEDQQEAAWDRMLEEHGDDFGSGFYAYGDELQWDNDSDYVKWELENSDGNNGLSPINDTRMMYTTDGLENNREIALVVPNIESWNKRDEIHFGDAGNGRAVAWVRFGETTDDKGNRVLVIDEIQSKRHQEGREKGYRTKELKTALAEKERFVNAMEEKYGSRPYNAQRLKELGATEEEIAEYKKLTAQVAGIPDAPFEKNWHELAMKRMLRYAAENGYDKVAWTTGEQQVERYDISKQVDTIQVNDVYGGEHEVVGYKDGKRVFSQPTLNGEKGLADLIGKDMARKAYSNLHEGKTDYTDEQGRVVLKGDNLRIGGEGMKGFYDQILPRFMDKYSKKWGAKVGEVTLPNVEKSAQKMWSVDVTDEMRESVMQGQTMFSIREKQEVAVYDNENGTELGRFVDFLERGKRLLGGESRYFHVGNAGNLLQQYGINGKITISNTTFNKRHSKDGHDISVDKWIDVIQNINNPIAISKYINGKNSYRIYTPIE